jgi:hypothetical protein
LPPAAAEYSSERRVIFTISRSEIVKTTRLSKYNSARSAVKNLFTQPPIQGPSFYKMLNRNWIGMGFRPFFCTKSIAVKYNGHKLIQNHWPTLLRNILPGFCPLPGHAPRSGALLFGYTLKEKIERLGASGARTPMRTKWTSLCRSPRAKSAQMEGLRVGGEWRWGKL